MTNIFADIQDIPGPSTDSFPANKKISGHFTRLCQLMMTVCVDLFRDVFDYFIKPAELQMEIREHFEYLSTMIDYQQICLLHGFLDFENGTLSSKIFDLPLLYILIRSICFIPPPTNGWGTCPEIDDRSLAANIERIRIYGIEILFYSEKTIETDFLHIWLNLLTDIDEIQKIIFKKNTYAKTVDELFSLEVILARYIDVFKRLQGKCNSKIVNMLLIRFHRLHILTCFVDLQQ